MSLALCHGVVGDHTVDIAGGNHKAQARLAELSEIVIVFDIRLG